MTATQERTTTVTQRAFVKGYRHGFDHGSASAREASTLLGSASADEIEAFCNGSDDGSIGDMWRLRQMGR